METVIKMKQAKYGRPSGYQAFVSQTGKKMKQAKKYGRPSGYHGFVSQTVIKMKQAKRGRPDSCVDATDWAHQVTCKIPACVAFYSRLREVRESEVAYENSKKVGA